MNIKLMGATVDFSPVIPIQTSNKNVPVWLAKNAGLLKIIRYQVLPALMENCR